MRTGNLAAPAFATGLVVGKFSPLHRGHEYLIDHALAQCGHLFILSYSNPEFPGMDAQQRQRWLMLRFPSATILVLDALLLHDMVQASGIAGPVPPIPLNAAPDDEQRSFVLWVCQKLFQCAVKAVFTSEAYGDGFAAYLQAGFSQQLGRAHPVAHVCLDPGRLRFPVSGTALRADPDLIAKWLPACVRVDPYPTRVRRVALLGGESSGKTSLASILAAARQTTVVPEYGRELWEQRRGQLTYPDLLHIALEQVRREDAATIDARQWLVCDTTPLTTLLYCLEMFGKAPPLLWQLSARAYDLVLLCAPDFPFVQDGTRRGAAFRLRQHEEYIVALGQRDMDFRLMQGAQDERLQCALALSSKAAAR